MYQALYRSFRPETFSEILGQEHIVKILKNQLAGDTVGHAYLFCGTRGTGKTSTARILAKAVNCTSEKGEKPCGVCANCLSIKEGTFMDVIEIDAASNNGVENIRELRESVKYPPAVGACKVYIIDEVHMLSSGAFNALLKTLEEPPAHVMFILATTEPQKLPATILSRCLRLDFRRVSETQLRTGMRAICGELGVKISDAALGLVAANADGSVRDALSLLDQCISAGGEEVTRRDVLDFLGTSGEEVFLEMTDFIAAGKVAEAIRLLNRILSDGKDERQFLKDWVAHYRSLLLTKYMKSPEDILNLSVENVERLREQARRLDLSQLNDGITELSKTLAEAKWSTQPRVLTELCIVKLCGVDGVSLKKAAAPKQKSQTVSGAGKEREREDERTESETPEISEEFVGEPDEDMGGDAQEEAVNASEEEDLDLTLLWNCICDDGESQKGSFNILRTGARLAEVTPDAFVLETSGAMSARYAETNVSWLADLMEKHTGKRRKALCRRQQEPQEQESIGDLVQKLETSLGIEIEIE